MSESRMSDAQWAASLALSALEDGRYRLAASLANIAHRAQLCEDLERATPPAAVMVPMAGPTREERPSEAPSVAPPFVPGPDATQIMSALSEQLPALDFSEIPPQRCHAMYWDSSARMNTECRAGIRPIPLTHKGGLHAYGWAHIDPAIDADHPATAVAAGSN